jgi:hypothetical protein
VWLCYVGIITQETGKGKSKEKKKDLKNKNIHRKYLLFILHSLQINMIGFGFILDDLVNNLNLSVNRCVFGKYRQVKPR